MNHELQSILRSIPALSYPGAVESDDRTDRPLKKRQKMGRQNRNSLKALSEAIILQSMEDLWTRSYRKESIKFFLGEGFRECADIAGMKVVDRLRVVKMVREMNLGRSVTKHAAKLNQALI